MLCGIGFGGIKANISPLGALQVEWFGEDAVHSFFNWFYWFVNVGGCIAYLFVIYIQQEIGFGIGYLIPALTLVAATIVFVLPRNFYREHTGWFDFCGNERGILYSFYSPIIRSYDG